jgi:hypothetical protein
MAEIFDPTLSSGAEDQGFDGYLIKAGTAGLVETHFKYQILQGRRFQAAIAGLPGLEYTSVTSAIKTDYVHLPFANNDKIRLIDGNNMTVRGVEEFHDKNLASMELPSLRSYIITLEGGGK